MAELTETELAQRRLAVENAIGTHAMEGIRIPASARALMDAFSEGKLSLSEFSAAMDAAALPVVTREKVLQGAA